MLFSHVRWQRFGRGRPPRSNAQIVEIIAVVAENIFTNLLNIVAGTEIDFPVVLTTEAA